ncbi:ester cyclase [Winogradskyella luteola]|uniref:Ester cyclase n=1 Tax=Winogradskyella luteola TaxID=2828330 RepID=A0A9X1F9N5_9FLAO|nr:ester cyclase [Winogradskyella luteola]MBV7269866.1 ester cyclase [Winogradskyella luteola]
MKKSILLITIAFLSLNIMAQKSNIDKDLKMYSVVWDNIVNKGDMSYFNTKYFDENITVLMQSENIVGIDALKAYYQNFITGFSDRKFTIVNSFGQGDQIVKHWRFKGKHIGDFFGMPATGNSVDVEGTTIVKMKNGKIAQEQDFFDSSVMMQQLGVMSNPDNVGIINSLYGLFSKGDVPSVLALFDENIVWNEAESNSLAKGNPYIGPQAVLDNIFAPIGGMYKSFSLSDIKLHEMSGNQVLATLYYMIDTKDGKHYKVQAAHHWSLKDGKITAFQQYADTKKLAETE